MAHNDRGPAFPRNGHPDKNDLPTDGMTLRDYFAAAALQGIIANPAEWIGPSGKAVKGDDEIAQAAWAMADAMLMER